MTAAHVGRMMSGGEFSPSQAIASYAGATTNLRLRTGCVAARDAGPLAACPPAADAASDTAAMPIQAFIL